MTDIDHEYTDNIVCPYCGYAFTPDESVDNSYREKCTKCSKEFEVESDYSVSYTTSKLCKENGMEHKWGGQWEVVDRFYHTCVECDRSEEICVTRTILNLK